MACFFSSSVYFSTKSLIMTWSVYLFVRVFAIKDQYSLASYLGEKQSRGYPKIGMPAEMSDTKRLKL